MRFTTIRFDGDTVGLKWEEKIAGAVDKHEWSCDEPPTPAFKAALASFSAFVVSLIEAPAAWAEGLEIRQLTLKEEDKGIRGIVITALHKCERAKNRTLLLNTPYMAQPPENYNGAGDGYLDDVTVAFIQELEAQAVFYRNGERGEQTSLELGDSDNSKAAGERMASAEVKSTRKAKKDKPVVVATDVEIADVTDDQVRQLLMTVERDVPVEAIGKWTAAERTNAIRWAAMQQKKLTGSLKGESMPDEPTVIKASATMPLLPSKPKAAATPRTVQ